MDQGRVILVRDDRSVTGLFDGSVLPDHLRMEELAGWCPIRHMAGGHGAGPLDLEEARYLAAERAYEAFHFGYEVIEDDGWHYMPEANEMRCMVELRGEAAAGQDRGRLITATFRVCFDGASADVAEAYAVDDGGGRIGYLPDEARLCRD